MDEQLESMSPNGSKGLLAWVGDLPQEGTEKLRRHHFTIFLVLGLPVLLSFAIYHLAYGNLIIGWATLTLSASAALARFLLRNLSSGLVLYRINAFLFGAMLLFFMSVGGPSGSKALWAFTFPLITNFLLGRREGSAWGAILFLAAQPLLWATVLGLPTFAYDREFALRYAVVYLVIMGVAYWFEFLRQHYRAGMEREQRRLLEKQSRLEAEMASRMEAEAAREALILELREALGKVKMLSGLLPICASCKKIRDDQGRWLQVETYVRDRSEAEFTHGICPECSHKFRQDEGLTK